MVGKGAGPLPTARSVVRDLQQIRQGWSLPPLEPGLLRPSDLIEQAWYLRCSVDDRPGVFAAVAGALVDENLSIREALQRQAEGGLAHIVLSLENCRWGQVRRVCQSIGGHSWCREVLCLPHLG